MLAKKMQPAIWCKQRTVVQRRCLYDNGREAVMDALENLGFGALEHPPYRPDLAPSKNL